MKENVGRTDRTIRAVVGPLLLVAGYAWMGGKEGKAGGLATMIAGALVTETALTRTCPLNQLFGIDTTKATGRPVVGKLLPFRSRRREPSPGWSAEAAEAEAAEGEGAARRREPVDYSSFVNAAASLTFIPGEETAEAAVKAVLGILASRLDEREAMRLAASLPDPLDYESLRGHQVNVTEISVEQYYGSLAKQFHITRDEAQVLAVTILRLVKEALDTEGLGEIERSLPGEWTDLIERV